MGADDSPSVRARLATPETVDWLTEVSVVEVNGTRLPLEAGQVQVGVQPDGRLRLDAVELDLADVEVSAPELERDLPLVGLSVTLAEPVVAEAKWSRLEDAAFAELHVDLILEWAIVTSSGRVVELAPQRIGDIPVDLDVYLGVDGRLNVFLYGTRPGVFWSWADLLELRDLVLDLRGVQGSREP